jgi:hypothetical protein
MVKLTAKKKMALAIEMLESIHNNELRFPDSDAHEYCKGCGRSPYNVPAHADGCKVVKLALLLKAIR